MRRIAGYSAVLVPALALWACAANPGPGESGYPFNLSGRARVNDSCGGFLSGTFALRR